MKKTFLLIAFFCIALPSYGYWHSKTYGIATITLLEQDKKGKILSSYLSGLEVSFFDKDGNFLAKGTRAHKNAPIYLIHPVVGACRSSNKSLSAKERHRSWRKCHAYHPPWISKWVPKAKQFQVNHPDCKTDKMPFSIRASNSENDWFLWWIPMPHGGASAPKTYFSISLLLKPKDCRR